jgi:hypothetical protein
MKYAYFTYTIEQYYNKQVNVVVTTKIPLEALFEIDTTYIILFSEFLKTWLQRNPRYLLFNSTTIINKSYKIVCSETPRTYVA